MKGKSEKKTLDLSFKSCTHKRTNLGVKQTYDSSHKEALRGTNYKDSTTLGNQIASKPTVLNPPIKSAVTGHISKPNTTISSCTPPYGLGLSQGKFTTTKPPGTNLQSTTFVIPPKSRKSIPTRRTHHQTSNNPRQSQRHHSQTRHRSSNTPLSPPLVIAGSFKHPRTRLPHG
ncbi:hypothetical protein HYFRA_00005869 [Hymenoscyphus fraxineus]|uniref:Uncharacterized protein n=1 Tax=Hymenoscyphus fraxineus TaxID=746836 RepID=A0A9N9KVH6_9HELO|nr:hypothetical protein HYFRA_00005869 [Hymenoscyphus fraxineus]